MKILIASVGKWKDATARALYNDYATRSRWEVTLQELGGHPKLEPARRKQIETIDLLEAARAWGAQHIVYLDEHVKPLTSRKFAAMLGVWQDEGARQIAFLIGGDCGLDPASLPNTARGLSLGAVTWPHLLVRGLLAEQLYRAQAILSGHPYHRD